MSMATATLEKIAVMQAYVEGKVIECKPNYIKEDQWACVDTPIWNWDEIIYRVKPTIPDTINWSVISPSYRFAARDKDGSIWVYKNKPVIDASCRWMERKSGGFKLDMDVLIICTQGGKPWNESLIERPEGV